MSEHFIRNTILIITSLISVYKLIQNNSSFIIDLISSDIQGVDFNGLKLLKVTEEPKINFQEYKKMSTLVYFRKIYLYNFTMLIWCFTSMVRVNQLEEVVFRRLDILFIPLFDYSGGAMELHA